MDKSKGVPVISVKTSGSKERVSGLFSTRAISTYFLYPLSFISILMCVLEDS